MGKTNRTPQQNCFQRMFSMKSQWCYGHIPFAWEYLLFCWLFESLWCLLSWPILISCPLLPAGTFCHCMPTCFIFSFHTDQSCLLGKPGEMKPPGLFQLIWTAAKARATLFQGLSFKNLVKNRTVNYYLFPEGISVSSYSWILWRLTPSNSSPKLWFGFTHVNEAVFLLQIKKALDGFKSSMIECLIVIIVKGTWSLTNK